MAYAFAAAGTAGHVYPALAVAEELVRRGIGQDEIVFFGGDRFEVDAVPGAGFELVSLPLIGLQRRFTLDNLRIPGVVRQATRTLRQAMEARAVRTLLATGSYVTIPAALAARRLQVPYFVQEQNAEAGLANRLAARGATAAFMSFEVTGGMNGTYVGNPIRPAVLAPVPDLAAARARYDIVSDRPVVGVVGGTLGSGAINEAVFGMVQGGATESLEVVHLVGQRFYEQWQATAADHDSWHVVGFEGDMRYFYAVSDVVISRAGGMVAELLATGTPAILVPGGFGSRGHQHANAERVAARGAAVVVTEPELGNLAATVAAVLEEPGTLAAMTKAAETAGRPQAARVIAERMVVAHGGAG